MGVGGCLTKTDVILYDNIVVCFVDFTANKFIFYIYISLFTLFAHPVVLLLSEQWQTAESEETSECLKYKFGDCMLHNLEIHGKEYSREHLVISLNLNLPPF